MKQIITRLDDDLADALKRQAKQRGESVNSFVTRLLRTAVNAGQSTPRQLWKVAATAEGRLAVRGPGHRVERPAALRTPAGYAAGLVSSERDER